MANGYKQALARFEEAVREHAFKGNRNPLFHDEIEKEYQESKQALISKLSYRKLAAEVKTNK